MIRTRCILVSTQQAEYELHLYSYRAGVHEVIAIFEKDQRVRLEMTGVHSK